MLAGRVEIAAVLGEFGDRECLVLHRLVDDGCLLNPLVDGDGGVDAVVLVGVALDFGLDDMVDLREDEKRKWLYEKRLNARSN